MAVASHKPESPELPAQRTPASNSQGVGVKKSFVGFLSAVQVASDYNAHPEARYQAMKVLSNVYGTERQETKSATVVKTAMAEVGGTVGGYLAPVEYSTAIMDAIIEDSFIWSRAHVIPMTTSELLAPHIDVETAPTSAGVQALLGNVVFQWGSEGSAAPESEPKFRQMSLKAWDLLGYIVVSNQFLADIGPEGEKALIRMFGRAAAWYTEYSFLQGTGAGSQMPLGILNSPCALDVVRQLSNQVSPIDIANMGADLLPYSWKNAIWACSPTVLGQIVKLSSFFLNAGEAESGNMPTMLTRPMYLTDKLPPLGTRGDLLLFDPWLYVIGSRMDLLVDVSPHANFRTNQSVIRIWLRLDGKPQVSSKITLPDTTSVVSPIVVLK